ncbi:MAG: AmmeMemoRadiSam system radical SAM enzyme [Candidatus Omnitrophica bacterium]|nr:AmmeMemoRadiSam system radical SAM enzyme [Candidatus Omnitrophota bacterium]
MNDSRDRFTRRDFLKIVGATGLGLAASGYIERALLGNNVGLAEPLKQIGYPRQALFYENLDEETVKCLLCPHECVMKNGQRSFCRAREPKNGKLYSLVYELVCALHVDPIEKKPLYHMLPGSGALSIATAGCNLRCKFCQNWQISQSPPEDTQNRILTCENLVSLAENNKCRSIAYTYSEPIVFYEYMYDTAALAKEHGIKNIAVTAGYIKEAPLRMLTKRIDAANVDLKAYDDKYLKDVCSERLEPLLKAIKIMKEEGVWVELTNLIVPTLNDDMEMIRKMSVWIRENLGTDVPLHFSRFWPMYKLKDLPPTPVSTLEEARKTAMDEGLNYVYVGNVKTQEANNTYCPNCKNLLIKRLGYQIAENNVASGACGSCYHKIAGIWK